MEYLFPILPLLFLIVLPDRGVDSIVSLPRQEKSINPINLDGAYELVYMAQDGKTFEVAEKALLDNLTLVINENKFSITFNNAELLKGNYKLSNLTVQFNVTTASDRDMLGSHTARMLVGDDVLTLTVEGEILIWQRA